MSKVPGEDPVLARRRAEAVRQAREMQARAHPPKETRPPEPPQRPSEEPQGTSGPLDLLFQDSERSLLLLLLLLLYEEGSSPELLFALFYLLIE